MSRIDFLPKFTVKVENGSGCLFQPVDDGYSYVLTARHVINKKKAPKIIRQTLDTDGNIINEPISIVGKPFLHSNSAIDAAIVKVKKVEGLQSLIRADLEGDNKDQYYLCGHPAARSDTNYSFRQNALTLQNKKPLGYMEAELARSANQNEIVGQSGGGVIKVEETCFLLAGIQKSMAADDEIEMLGRIEFIPISLFDEIIEQNKNDLSLLFPPYIKSFDRLLTDIFLLPNMLGNKNLVQNELKNIAKALCVDFIPEQILEIFGETFLVNGTDKAMINHKQLWISFLEILSFNQLHEINKLTIAELKEIHKKRKLYFAETDEWTKKLEDIYKTDLSVIEKGGCVVISTTGDNTPPVVEIDRHFIGDIGLIPQEEMIISNTVIDPIKDLRIVHIFKFQNHLISNARAYAEITSGTVRKKLKDETKDLI